MWALFRDSDVALGLTGVKIVLRSVPEALKSMPTGDSPNFGTMGGRPTPRVRVKKIVDPAFIDFLPSDDEPEGCRNVDESDCIDCQAAGRACRGHHRVSLWNTKWCNLLRLSTPIVKYFDRTHFICLVCEDAHPTRKSKFKKAFGWRGNAFESHCSSITHQQHLQQFCDKHGGEAKSIMPARRGDLARSDDETQDDEDEQHRSLLQHHAGLQIIYDAFSNVRTLPL